MQDVYNFFFFIPIRIRRSKALTVDEKRFETSRVCPVCKGFYKYGLAWHVATHTDHRPHKCDLCGKAFKRSDALRRHRETHAAKKTSGSRARRALCGAAPRPSCGTTGSITRASGVTRVRPTGLRRRVAAAADDDDDDNGADAAAADGDPTEPCVRRGDGGRELLGRVTVRVRPVR